MGAAFSQAIEDAKERGDNDFTMEGSIKIKSKESPAFAKKLAAEMPDLQVLDIKGSKLKTLPTDIILFKKLEILRVEDCKLTSLPSELCQIEVIEELDLASNAFQKIPLELSRLRKLTTVNLANNQISSIPEMFFETLFSLNLTKNEFPDFPINVCKIPSLQKIYLNENKLATVPEEIGMLQNLLELHLRSNQLTTLPETISKLSNLLHLDISENKITKLPAAVSSLSQLVTLEAQHNLIDVLPVELCSIDTLLFLKLHDNQISEIPKEIESLTNLSELYLQENKITVIPVEITKLGKLKKLYLEFNKISALPEQISNLKKLVVLILHHNNISTLPDSLTEMAHLLRFSLDDNPLNEETLGIIRKGGALALIHRDDPKEGGLHPEDKKKNFNSIKRRSLRHTADSTRGSNNLQRSNSVQAMPKNPSTEISAIQAIKKGKKEKAKDAETGVPSYSKFKSAFDSLLEEQDFSKKKKEILKKMSEEEKWTLLNQYKGSTLELLKNQSKPGSRQAGRRSTSQKGAADLVQSLKENRVNKNTMNRMKVSLKENKAGWASKFIEAGGITALTHHLNNGAAKPKLSARDHSLLKDSLEIFEILLGISFKSILTSSGAVCAIALPLTLDCNTNKWLTVKLLEYICSKELNIGAQLVFEAISLNNQKFDEEIPLFSLVQLLEADDSPSVTKAAALALINQLIDSIEALEPRFRIRTGLSGMGFATILDQLKMTESKSAMIQMEIDIYEDETQIDYEDMHCRSQRTSIIKKISPSGDGNLAIEVITDCVHQDHSVEITPDTTIGKVHQQIVNQFSIVSPTEYGLVYASPDGDEKWFLEESVIFAECGLTPEQMSLVVFRMIPWDVELSLPDDRTCMITLDPNTTCEQALAKAIATYPLPDADYCFMLGSEVLQEAKSLQRSLGDKRKLKVAERPLRLRVVLGDDAWQMIDFDPSIKITKVFEQISNHVGRKFDSEKFSLVMEAPDHPEPKTLDNDQTLVECCTYENCSLRFISKGVAEDKEEEEEECNIWDEPADSPFNITFEKGKDRSIQNIETATLNKLVERATSCEEYDLDFVNVFIMMYKAFTTEDRLWQKLVERYRVPEKEADSKPKIQVRVCVFMKNWVEKAGFDFHEKLRNSIKDFLENEAPDNLAKAIADRLDNPKANIPILDLTDPEVKKRCPDPIVPRSSKNLSFTDIDTLEVARQLTIHTFAIFQKIKVTEFFKGAWSKEKLKHLAPNILEMIDFYNSIAASFATIIVSAPDLRSRTKLVQKIIEVGKQLLNLHNYHLVSALVSAINNSAIDRLKFTMARISRRHRQALEDITNVVSMEGAFKNFREALAAAGPPAIPFMGAYLTDLVFIADGNADKIDNRIHYSKHKFVYNTVARIQTYQKENYYLRVEEKTQAFLLNLPQLDDKGLYARSLVVEPRGSTRADLQ